MNSCKSFDAPSGPGETYRAPLIPNTRVPGIMRHRLFVDSGDCVANLSTFEFTVYLSDPFRETSIGVARFERVKSVELKALAFPKIINEDYVIMDIQELNDERLHSSNDAANRAFAVMYFDANTLQPGEIKPMKGYDFYQKDISFNPIIPSLSKLTVKFLDKSGTIVSKVNTGNVNQCSFMLEITTLVN
jgi:hypothetical protein